MGFGLPYDRWKKKSYDDLPPVILAAGPEAPLKEEFLEGLRNDFPDPDRQVVNFYADEIEPDELASELRSPGLFSETTWVVLKQLGRRSSGRTGLQKHLAVIEDYLEDPEPGTVLILEDSDHPYKGGRKLGKVAAGVEDVGGWVVIFWEPFEGELRDRVRERLNQAGKKIEASALQKLLEKTSGKLARAQLEADKLIQLDEARISRGTVERVVSEESAGDIFQEIKDKLAAGDVDAVLAALDDLYREGEPPFKIFSVIFSHLTTVRTLRRELKRGKNLTEALKAENIPTSKGIVKRYRRALKQLTDNFPRSFFRDSYEISRKIKYGRPESSRLALQEYLIKILPQLRSY